MKNMYRESGKFMDKMSVQMYLENFSKGQLVMLKKIKKNKDELKIINDCLKVIEYVKSCILNNKDFKGHITEQDVEEIYDKLTTYPDLFDDVDDKAKLKKFIEDYMYGALQICSECGKVHDEGFCVNGGDEYYCSEECLHKHYSKEEWEEMYEEDEYNNYWTQWWVY